MALPEKSTRRPSRGRIPSPKEDSPARKPANGPKKRPLPDPAGSLQVNHCRNPNCENFGVPPTAGTVKHGAAPGHVAATSAPPASEVSCRNAGCGNHGEVLEQNPGLYRLDPVGGNAWTTRWICRACRKTFRVAVPNAPPPPAPGPRHRDRYLITKGGIKCNNCGENVNLRSNAGIHEELERLSEYLVPRPAASCPNEECDNHGEPVDGADMHLTSPSKLADVQRQDRSARKVLRSVASGFRRPLPTLYVSRLMGALPVLLEAPPGTRAWRSALIGPAQPSGYRDAVIFARGRLWPASIREDHRDGNVHSDPVAEIGRALAVTRRRTLPPHSVGATD